tara:strand:+ start:56 stop:451 length:396 start_codon:yes stop_codon:yes gene_type:complete
MNKEILKIALNTKNLSYLSKHTHFSKLKNRNCGDEIKIYLIVKNNKIIKMKYEGESCVYTQAIANLLSESILNKSSKNIDLLLKHAKNQFHKEKIYSNNWKKILKLMNKSNNSRKDCLLLPIKATLLALKK